MPASTVTLWTPAQATRSGWTSRIWIGTGYTPDATHDYLKVSFQVARKQDSTLQSTLALPDIALAYFALMTANAAGDSANDNNLDAENEFVGIISRHLGSGSDKLGIGRTSAGEMLVAFSSDSTAPLNGRFQTYTIEDSAPAVPVVIPENDDLSAFNDADVIPRVLNGQAAFKVSNLARLRTYMQQGVMIDISGKLDRDLSNVGTVPAPGAFRNAIGAGSQADLTSKLNKNLSSVGPNDVPEGNKRIFRGVIQAKKADITLSSSQSTIIATVGAGEIVFFSDISEHYANVSGQTQLLQARLIPSSPQFTRAHLPRVTAAERQAGTSAEYRAFSPSDIENMIDTHAGGGVSDYNQLSNRPLVYADTLPAPTTANSNVIYFNGHGQSLQFYTQIGHSAVNLSVTYRPFNDSDLPAAWTWRGVLQDGSDINTGAAQDNEVWYIRNQHGFLRWDDAHSELRSYTPDDWRGSYGNKADADDVISIHAGAVVADAIGQHIAYGGYRDAIPYTVTAYTPAQSDTREWATYHDPQLLVTIQALDNELVEHQASIDELLARNEFTDGDEMKLDGITAAWIVAQINADLGNTNWQTGGTEANITLASLLALVNGTRTDGYVIGWDQTNSRLEWVNPLSGVGSAAYRNIGTQQNNVVALDANGLIPGARLAANPQAATVLGRTSGNTAAWLNYLSQADIQALINASPSFAEFTGTYDSNTTYSRGQYAVYDDGTGDHLWFVHDAAQANANAPSVSPSSGWRRGDLTATYRGIAPVGATTYVAGDEVGVPGQGIYLCTNGTTATRAQITNTNLNFHNISSGDITSGNVVSAVSGSPDAEDLIVHAGPPESRLEWLSNQNDAFKTALRTLLGVGGGGSEQRAVKVLLNTQSSLTIGTSWLQTVSRFDDNDLVINKTGWTRGTSGGNQYLNVPAGYGGTYQLSVIVNFDIGTGTLQRSSVRLRSRVTDSAGTTLRANSIMSQTYNRGNSQSSDLRDYAVILTGLIELQAGDRVNFEMSADETVTGLSIEGSSYLSLHRV